MKIALHCSSIDSIHNVTVLMNTLEGPRKKR